MLIYYCYYVLCSGPVLICLKSFSFTGYKSDVFCVQDWSHCWMHLSEKTLHVCMMVFVGFVVAFVLFFVSLFFVKHS